MIKLLTIVPRQVHLPICQVNARNLIADYQSFNFIRTGNYPIFRHYIPIFRQNFQFDIILQTVNCSRINTFQEPQTIYNNLIIKQLLLQLTTHLSFGTRRTSFCYLSPFCLTKHIADKYT